jgi:hypothetical protein
MAGCVTMMRSPRAPVRPLRITGRPTSWRRQRRPRALLCRVSPSRQARLDKTHGRVSGAVTEPASPGLQSRKMIRSAPWDGACRRPPPMVYRCSRFLWGWRPELCRAPGYPVSFPVGSAAPAFGWACPGRRLGCLGGRLVVSTARPRSAPNARLGFPQLRRSHG